MKYDYIVIGGGLGGLCSAIILAKENKKVLVLEQHFKAGGYLHSFSRRGHRFETGFHFASALEKSQILNMYWDYLGVLDKIKLVPYSKEHFNTLIFPDHELKVPSGFDNLESYLSEVFPAERETISTFISKMKEIKRHFIYFNRDHKGNLEKEHASFEITIVDYLNSINASKELQAALLAHSFLYGVPPEETPLGTHAVFFNAFYSSAFDIEGGGDGLIKALVESLKENGGEIEFKKRVTAVKARDKKVIGVETADECFYETEGVVCSINPQSGLELVQNEDEGAKPVFRKVYTNRIKEMENTISHYGLYLTSPADLSSYRHDTLYFPNYDIDSIYKSPVSAFPDDFFLYFTVPTARLGSSKGEHIVETLSVDYMANYREWEDSSFGKRPQAYTEFKERISQTVIERLERIMPEIKGQIGLKEISTPLTNRHFTLSPEGSIFGIKHNMQQMRAPIRARTKLANFYFTGQSLIFPGIVGVTITGFVTCSDILGQEYLFSRIDGEAVKAPIK